jgi:hypothetical protein
MDAFVDTSVFAQYVRKTVLGYHLINDAPIKEAVWETILCSALDKSKCMYDYKAGSHCSGQDIVLKSDTADVVNTLAISCKSCKETAKSLVLSSYRLTTCKSVDDFVNEIDNVRANFQYYGVISRVEKDTTITYNIYLIPAKLIKASEKVWNVKYKRTTKTSQENAAISQWDTVPVNGVQLSIKAAMSNQLWITLDKEQFAQYCVCENIVVKNKKIIDYCSLFDKLSLEDDASSS